MEMPRGALAAFPAVDVRSRRCVRGALGPLPTRGGKGRWDRIAERVREDVERHREIPAFRDSIAAGRFELTLVTATERKAERLRPVLDEASRASGVPVRVHVVAALIDLIAPPPRS